jgi:titin
VDLVLSGHSHSYERSFLLDGHYGTSDTLTAQMKKDTGGGREDATGAYTKPASPAPHEGAVYVVAGSSGKISGGLLNHPAMYVSLNQLGSLVLDINTNRLDAKFLTSTGATNDYFTILKNAPSNSPPTVTLTSPAEGATFLEPATITVTADASDADGTVSEVNFYSGTTLIGTDSSSAFSITWNNVAAGNYTLTAIATDNLGLMTTSVPVHITVNPPPAPPVAPGNLSATAVSSNRIDLAWSDNSTNETGFAIERSTDGVNFSQITTVAANLTSYSNTGLAASTTYFYRVRALGNAGPSGYSNVASATTGALGAPPAAPANLAATPVSKSQINLAWADLANNETGFKIERSIDGISFTQVGTAGANVTSFASTGLQGNKKYYYRVRANNSNGDSAYSNIASARTLRK